VDDRDSPPSVVIVESPVVDVGDVSDWAAGKAASCEVVVPPIAPAETTFVVCKAAGDG